MVTFRVSETVVAHPTKDRYFSFEFRPDCVIYSKIGEKSDRPHIERLTRIQALRRFKWLTERLGYQKIISESHTITIGI